VTIGQRSRTVSAPEVAAANPAHRQVPALTARPGGYAERFATAVGDRHPALVFALALLAGLLLLLAASIVLGLIVVDGLVSNGGLGLEGTDESFNDTLADSRTGTLTTIAEVGSHLGAAVLVSLVALVVIVCLLKRRWLIAAFALFALLAESATYHFTSLAVPRQRPSVPRLEDLEADTSYPSGHTAAAVAVYAGLVLLLTTRFTSSLTKALAWTGAILLISFVALSRMYQGMHHPLDVLGGVLVGIGAILVALFACRAAGAAAERRRRQ
jgi:membrane-associated phospholipid phosphatase